jgi:hypothetical protein
MASALSKLDLLIIQIDGLHIVNDLLLVAGLNNFLCVARVSRRMVSLQIQGLNAPGGFDT